MTTTRRTATVDGLDMVAFDECGAYFAVVNGVLMCTAMFVDGSAADGYGEVECWEYYGGELDAINAWFGTTFTPGTFNGM